ncbi:MAG: hypothetical protein IPJ06_16140 [Saprospiraceae bacterium]|nr:hypothetical protein [Saprospiraceae bacterium]
MRNIWNVCKEKRKANSPTTWMILVRMTRNLIHADGHKLSVIPPPDQ